MIKTRDIIESLDKEDKVKYQDMLNQVNLPDFYKCISQFSGLPINEVDDNVMIRYLTTWAKNKYRFYKMLGNKLRLDKKFVYKRQNFDFCNQYHELEVKYKPYALWLKLFDAHTENIIGNLAYTRARDYMREFFPDFKYEKSSITHFFKSELNAPDTLVTGIGKIYENMEIEATHTLSIDPVDIMLASENPYDWTSCYRLELSRPDSHADGCMAAVLDTSSLIAYVWSSEGQYNLYDKFKFKSVRYYRIRQWINISDKYEAIHFASAYPNRENYATDLNKQLRKTVAETVSAFAGVENSWRKIDFVSVDTRDWKEPLIRVRRANNYGYDEFEDEYVIINNILLPKPAENAILKRSDIVQIRPYNEDIECACGCGAVVCPSGDAFDTEEDACDGDVIYTGEGFTAQNFYTYEDDYETKWCPYLGDECDFGCCKYDECSKYCKHWQLEHAHCSLDPEGNFCSQPDPDMTSYIDGVCMCKANKESCKGCPRFSRSGDK